MHCQIPDNVDTFATDVPLLHDAKTHDDDPSLSFFDDDMSCSDDTSLSDDKSLSYEESNVIEELFQNHVATSSTLKEGPSDYVCFTTTQKCVTSLMLLLDLMECPNYAFEEIMKWARTSFESGFDFNPKCKT